MEETESQREETKLPEQLTEPLREGDEANIAKEKEEKEKEAKEKEAKEAKEAKEKEAKEKEIAIKSSEEKEKEAKEAKEKEIAIKSSEEKEKEAKEAKEKEEKEKEEKEAKEKDEKEKEEKEKEIAIKSSEEEKNDLISLTLENLIKSNEYTHTQKRNWHLFRSKERSKRMLGGKELDDFDKAIMIDLKDQKHILLTLGEYISIKNKRDLEGHFIVSICYIEEANRRRLEIIHSNDSLNDVASIEISRITGFFILHIRFSIFIF
jgi:hypothetical protein